MKEKLLPFSVMLAVLAAGCTSSAPAPEQKAENPAPAMPVVIDLTSLRARCGEFVRAMTRSLQSGDFSEWRKALESEGVPGKPLAVNQERFQVMYRNLKQTHGTLVKSAYLGELDQGICRDFLWVFTFRAPNGGPKEEIFAVRCADFNGTPAIAGFGFRFFNNPRARAVKK